MNKNYFKNLRWTPTGKFVFIHHVAALIGLPFYFYYAPPGWSMIVAATILFYVTGLGITAGYHRLYAHSAFKLKKPAEAIFLFFATMAIQGPLLKWAYDHRMHHQYVDKEGDPYNVIKGFWYAHFLWIFDTHPNIDPKVVPDLLRNRLVMFQYRHYILLAIASNTIVSLFVGWLLGDYVGAFVLCWGVRLLFTYHATWFVNSLAHYWGEQSYSKELSARDNIIVAFLTLGEGYHNYHHTFPADYRNGVRWLHFDPVKWVIWILSKFGLASQLRRFHTDMIMNKLINLDTNLLLQRIAQFSEDQKRLKIILGRYALETRAALKSYIERVAESLKTRRLEMHNLIKEYKALRLENKKANALKRQAIKARIKKCRLSYMAEWKNWSALCKTILTSH